MLDKASGRRRAAPDVAEKQAPKRPARTDGSVIGTETLGQAVIMQVAERARRCAA
jgi:hypothetical protein